MSEMKMTSNGRWKTKEGPRRKFKIVCVFKYQPEFQANCLSRRLSGAHPSLFLSFVPLCQSFRQIPAPSHQQLTAVDELVWVSVIECYFPNLATIIVSHVKSLNIYFNLLKPYC